MALLFSPLESLPKPPVNKIPWPLALAVPCTSHHFQTVNRRRRNWWITARLDGTSWRKRGTGGFVSHRPKWVCGTPQTKNDRRQSIQPETHPCFPRQLALREQPPVLGHFFTADIHLKCHTQKTVRGSHIQAMVKSSLRVFHSSDIVRFPPARAVSFYTSAEWPQSHAIHRVRMCYRFPVLSVVKTMCEQNHVLGLAA